MKQKGPWEIQSSVKKYENPWMSVTEDKVIRPDGEYGIFGVVTILSGVSVLAMDDEGYVYLTKEYHYGIERVGIETVSGGKNSGEAFLDTAKRELKEELGIEATKWVDLGRVDPLTTNLMAPVEIYLAQDLIFKEPNQEGTEVITMKKVKFEKAVEMVMSSEITHGPSCILILKAKEYLKV